MSSGGRTAGARTPSAPETKKASRASGTENIYKIYAESFVDQSHLNAIVVEARAIVDSAMGSSA